MVDVQEDDHGDIVHARRDVDGGRAGAGSTGARRQSTGRGASTTCSSTRGSTCCRRPSIACIEARTVSFHLGSDSCTIDLSTAVTPRQIAAAEAEANRIVWENRPVAIRFVTVEEAAHLPLRKDPARQGTLRVIDIDGFDLSACGGTHVARTGDVGIIAITDWERFKGGQRLEFACGARALARFRSLRDWMSAAVRKLSVTPGELTLAIDRLQADVRAARRDRDELQSELARYRAHELIASAAEPVPAGLAVIRVIDGDMALLKSLAAQIVSEPGRLAVLVSKDTPSVVVVAASPDTGIASDKVLSVLLARFGGRGGGKAGLAQGGGLTGSPDALASEARTVIWSGRP